MLNVVFSKLVRDIVVFTYQHLERISFVFFKV